ncbi:acetyl-CoA sensor PanZ family protein [Bacterioplanoides sp.]|uniref:acetyl-CoA sensor PanZ family protein n=1 Tax=Bacterioplanoides sp. TaxID=2066072 RepID=UPI003AFFBB4E
MPVRLEHIRQPNDADWQDIGKIHQETSDNGLTDTSEQLQQKLDNGSWILAGRFNDRIIGLMIATETEQGVLLEQAAVRQITQRRGVLHQLLHHTQKWAKEEEKTLIIQSLPEYLRAAIAHRDFVNKSNNWVYNP